MAGLLARTLSGMFSNPFENRYHQSESASNNDGAIRPVHLSDPWSTRRPASGVLTKARMYVVKAGSYDGERKDNQRHGKGSYIWACGQKYYGEWVDDVRCGEGTEAWWDGRKYHGQWKDDMFDGEGVFTWADGRVFKGKFKCYCPVEGLLYMPDRTMFEVRYAGDTPVHDGTIPMPLSRKRIQDPIVIESNFEAMFSELSKSRIFSQALREQFIKYDDVELSHHQGTLCIDEVIIDSEDVFASMEVRLSYGARRISQDPRRHGAPSDQIIERIPSHRKQLGKDYARQASPEFSQISLEMSRRVSNQVLHMSKRTPSLKWTGSDNKRILRSGNSFGRMNGQLPVSVPPQPRTIAA